MNLTGNQLSSLCKEACKAALVAGKFIQDSIKKDLKIMNKGINAGESLASQVVTEIDLESQAIILKHLQPTCKEFDLGLLSEETPDDGSRFDKEYFWCIDPLDGTLYFSQGQPGYAVSIGLVDRSGVPQIGVVYDPVADNLYQAHKGQGAFLNGQPPRSAAVQQAETLAFFTDSSFQNHRRFNDTVESLHTLALQLGYNDLQVIAENAAVMNACHVLTRGDACYLKLPKNEPGGGSLWDFAATACLFQVAGAWVSDMQLQPLELNRADSTFMNHTGVLFSSNAEISSKVSSVLTAKK